MTRFYLLLILMICCPVFASPANNANREWQYTEWQNLHRYWTNASYLNDHATEQGRRVLTAISQPKREHWPFTNIVGLQVTADGADVNGAINELHLRLEKEGCKSVRVTIMGFYGSTAPRSANPLSWFPPGTLMFDDIRIDQIDQHAVNITLSQVTSTNWQTVRTSIKNIIPNDSMVWAGVLRQLRGDWNPEDDEKLSQLVSTQAQRDALLSVQVAISQAREYRRTANLQEKRAVDEKVHNWEASFNGVAQDGAQEGGKLELLAKYVSENKSLNENSKNLIRDIAFLQDSDLKKLLDSLKMLKPTREPPPELSWFFDLEGLY